MQSMNSLPRSSLERDSSNKYLISYPYRDQNNSFTLFKWGRGAVHLQFDSSRYAITIIKSNFFPKKGGQKKLREFILIIVFNFSLSTFQTLNHCIEACIFLYFRYCCSNTRENGIERKLKN